MRSTDPDVLIELLETRTRRDLCCLHYAKTSAGYRCLDFDVSAPTIEEVNTGVLAAFDALADTEDPLPVFATEAEWRALLTDFTYRDFFVLPRQSYTQTEVPLVVVVLEGEF